MNVIDKYTLHNKLGEGGYATVYKCTDSIGVRYACKVLPKEKNKRNRVTNEVATMKSLVSSPKVVRFIDACEDEHAFYIIQEWCRGGSVNEYVQNFPSYGENTVASIVRGTLRGLCHMHEKGIIHADIKTNNIFLGDLSEDSDVKIGDFGTAVITHNTDTCIEVDELVGTPWFMAPENLSSYYHTSSDIWSVGVMTYQLLSGGLPFSDKEYPLSPRVNIVWKEILQGNLAFSKSRWIHVSKDAQEFVATCLQRNYHKRPSARECLQHPWLTQTDCHDRFKGKPLTCTPFTYDENAMTMTPL